VCQAADIVTHGKKGRINFLFACNTEVEKFKSTVGKLETVSEHDLTEVLADAQAYFSAGEWDGATDILLEALEELDPASESAERIYKALGGLCCSFYTACKIQEGKATTKRIVEYVLGRLDRSVDAPYLDIYVSACVETGSSPFPIRRVFRHGNLVDIFRSVPDTVAGDVAECGCARGLSFLQLCLAHAEQRPQWNGFGFHIFDSFEGLSEPSEHDQEDSSAASVGENMQAGYFAFPLELVSKNIHSRFPRVELHRGWIPSSFATQPERVYRFVHIDVDLYQPTIDSLRYFFPRLAEGGIVITDDYNWPGARKAFDEYFGGLGLRPRITDTNQAYLIRTV
jgi:tetratricopeptide (TPR) repeat protein